MKQTNFSVGADVDSQGIRYRVWAPICDRVEVEVIASDATPARRIALTSIGRGYFEGFDEKGKVGDLYKFRLNGAQTFPDPASRFQPQGVHGPSAVVDSRSFPWSDQSWKQPRFRDLVIYELHIGTFTEDGTFRAAIKKLPHLRDIGVTAIEIMPLADFAGERNWGYDGVCLYAPSHAYGHPDDLRALVDAAHGIGLSVILDVVFNHFGPDGNYLGCYIGEYLDESKKTPWGGAIRYGDPAFRPLREFVTANPLYWMREFHIDGFRLDATHAITDESPRHLLQEIAGSVHEAGGFVIAEDPRNEALMILPEGEGGYGFDGVWADDFHHTARVANTREREAYLADFAGTLPELVETLQHGWLYRGQHSTSHGRERGTECRHISPEKFVHCISNHDQTGNHAFGERLHKAVSPEAYRAASALLCLSPYTPMLFMGQEWAATTPFLFFTDHSAALGKLITEGRREEFREFKAFEDPELRARIPDPQSIETFFASKLRWSELESSKAAGTLGLYRACLQMRNREPAFRPTCRESWQAAELRTGAGALRLGDQSGDWLLIFDLVGGHSGPLNEDAICQPRAGFTWGLEISSNEHRFDGDGVSALIGNCTSLDFRAPELIVLRERLAA